MIRFFKTPDVFRNAYPERVWGFSSSDTVYLTFDDGPTEELTNWILSTLAERNVKATFFCVGENAKKHPELIAKIVSEGHAIGNHTMCHEKGWNVKREDYLQSIEEASNYIDSKLFRPPYGKMPRKFDKDLKAYSIIMWSWLSYDYDPKVPIEKILAKAEEQIKPGDVIVLHDNLKVRDRIQELLPALVDILQQKGYKFDVISA